MRVAAFDVGIGSIGWCVCEQDSDYRLIDGGVRIFNAAENKEKGTSLAAPRRVARSKRRQINRRKIRINAIKELLCNEFKKDKDLFLAKDNNLAPIYQTSKHNKSPWELRVKALDEKLSVDELMRVILHIAKHRGYAYTISNKDIQKSGDESEYLTAINNNETNIKNYRSGAEMLFKQYFNKEIKKGFYESVRNNQGSYKNSLSQTMTRDELALILKTQEKLGFKFSTNFKDEILKTTFFRRPLKDFSDKVANCKIFKDEKRAPKSALSSLEFIAISRIINELKALCNENLGLNFNIKEIVTNTIDEAMKAKELTYAKFRKIINLDENIKFKIQKPENTKFISLNEFVQLKKLIGSDFSSDEFNQIALCMTLSKDKNSLKTRLNESGFEFSDEILYGMLDLKYSGFIELSFKVIKEILPLMKDGFRYDEACAFANLKEWATPQKSDLLVPFVSTTYANDVNNPVVLRAVKEYRKVLNEIIKKHGKVHKIHIELARDINRSFSDRKKIEKQQENNRKKNEEALKICKDIGLDFKTDQNILKIKLWQEQDEFCIYSGKKISINDIKENLVEIDHILPYSRSFDDSQSNKVLVLTKHNQEKANKTPYEAFGSNKELWDSITQRAKQLKKNTKNEAKFTKLTRTDFADVKESEFIQRNLNDTRYIAKLVKNYTKDYLNFLKFDDDKTEHILCVNGSLTSTLRHYWGLGNKDRSNHIHHFIDASIISACSPKIVKAFSDFIKTKEISSSKRYANEINKEQIKAKFRPFANFKKDIENFIKDNKIFISKSPDKKVTGELHEDTIISKDDISKEAQYKSEKGLEAGIRFGKIRQIRHGFVKNGKIKRVDIFMHKNSKKFYGVPIYTMDFALGVLPNMACVAGKDKKGNIKEWIFMDENFEFKFSLFKNDLIKIKQKNMKDGVVCYYRGFDTSNATIKVEKHDLKTDNLNDDEKLFYKTKQSDIYKASKKGVGIQNLLKFEKLIVSPLGKISEFRFEERQNARPKTSKKSSDV